MDSYEQYEKRARAAFLAIRRADYSRYKDLITCFTNYLEAEAERVCPQPPKKNVVIKFPGADT